MFLIARYTLAVEMLGNLTVVSELTRSRGSFRIKIFAERKLFIANLAVPFTVMFC